jgi:beta-xylosidase
VRRLVAITVVLALALTGLTAASGVARAAQYTNPVLPGQQPDPTVARDGSTYYLSVTSRAWAPIFPMYRSTDLVNWKPIGGALQHPPAWAAPPFWAPELVDLGGQKLLYYAARLRGIRGLPCIGVATATSTGGPYRDSGEPLVCPPDGAIDPFVSTDENGTPFLIYRRFGGDGGIWAQQLTPDGRSVVGDEVLLLATQIDDEGVVEGPAVTRRDGVYYLFFAARDCCKPPCDYVEEVARSTSLFGPYTRDPQLALGSTPALRCPGHGTLVDDLLGGSWFLHHAVLRDDPANARRSTVLDPVTWQADGWPSIGSAGLPVVTGEGPPGFTAQQQAPLAPNLHAARLDLLWQWPWGLRPRVTQRDGAIVLRGSSRGAVLARQVAPVDVTMQVRVTPHACAAGLAGFEGAEDAGEAIGAEVTSAGRVRVWRGTTGAGAGRTIALSSRVRGPAAAARAAARAPRTLRMTIRDGQKVRFALKSGSRWVNVGSWVTTPANRGLIQLGMTCRGTGSSSARFDSLKIAR